MTTPSPSMRGWVIATAMIMTLTLDALSRLDAAITLDFSVDPTLTGSNRLTLEQGYLPLRFAFFVDDSGNVTVDARVISVDLALVAAVDAWDGPCGTVSDPALFGEAFEIEIIGRDFLSGDPLTITLDGIDGGVLGIEGNDSSRIDGAEFLDWRVLFGEIADHDDRMQVEFRIQSVTYGNALENTADLKLRDKNTETTFYDISGSKGTLNPTNFEFREHESTVFSMPTDGDSGIGISGITFEVVSSPIFMPIPADKHPYDYLVYEDFERNKWPYYKNSDPSNKYRRILDGVDNPIGTGYGEVVADLASEFEEKTYRSLIGTSDAGTSAYYEAFRWSFDLFFNEGDNAGKIRLFGSKDDWQTNYHFGETILGDGTFAGLDITDGVQRFDVYVNDFETSLEYTDPNGKQALLAANEIAYWVNGVLALTETMFTSTLGTIDNFSVVGLITPKGSETGRISITTDNWIVEDLDSTPQAPPAPSHLVDDTDPDNLQYGTFDNIGQDFGTNILPDYSHSGYKGGGVPIPFVPAVMTISPVPGDDYPQIQAAIDHVSSLPMGPDGFRGALLLEPGVYEVSKTAVLGASGVVIRGSGTQEVGGTKIITTWVGRREGRALTMENPRSIKETVFGETPIIESFVPIGSRTLKVADATIFEVGDLVKVWCKWNAQWTDDVEYDELGKNARLQRFVYRNIVGISGNEITINSGTIHAIWDYHGGGTVSKVTRTGYLENSGVENIRFESTATDPFSDLHSMGSVGISGFRNSWIRQVTGHWFGNGTGGVNNSFYITVEDCAHLDHKDDPGGRYTFVNEDFTHLHQRCYARGGRHDFLGNGAFVDCSREYGTADVGPHNAIEFGGLYDNIKGGVFAAQNGWTRGNSNHGWEGFSTMFWNCDGTWNATTAPIGSINWAVGFVGGKRLPTEHVDPLGYWESHNQHVTPRSLYYSQLRDRLGYNAVQNVIIPEQADGNIWKETWNWNGNGILGSTIAAWLRDGPDPDLAYLKATVRNLRMLDNGISVQWFKSAGPGNVIFSDSGTLETTAVFDQAGTYTLRVNVTDQVTGKVESGMVEVEVVNEIGTTVEFGGSDARLAHVTFDSDVSDSAGNLSLSLQGGASIAEDTGQFGGAVRLDGENEAIAIADNVDLNSGEGPWPARTISLWFSADSVSGRQMIYEEGGGSAGFNIYLVEDSLYVGGWDVGGGWSGTWRNIEGITPGVWHHVALVLKATASPTVLADGQFFAYLNGVEFDANSSAGMEMTRHGNDVALGGLAGVSRYHDGGSGPENFTGYIDDFALWNRALGALDVAWLTGETVSSNFSPSFSVDPLIVPKAGDEIPYSETLAGLATDPEGDTLIFSKVSGPGWLNVGADGSLSGIPSTSDRGENSFTVMVEDDGNGGNDTAELRILVHESGNVLKLTTEDSSGLICYIPFDEDISDLTGNFEPSYPTHSPGTVLQDRGIFDGSFEGILSIGGRLNFDSGENPMTQLTLSLWFMLTDVDGDQMIYETGSATRSGLNIFTTGNTLNVRGSNISSKWSGTTRSTTILANRWYHVAVVIDASTSPTKPADGQFFAYLNGQEIDPGKSRGMQLSNIDSGVIGFVEGSSNTGNADPKPMRGFVDDFAIWDRPLSSSEISIIGTIPRNTPPSFNSDPFRANDALEADDPEESEIYSDTLLGDVTDPDGDPLFFLKIDGPDWLGVAKNGEIGGTPNASDLGLNTFTVMVLDNQSGADIATLEVMVTNVNDAPTFKSELIYLSDAREREPYADTLAGFATDEDPTNDLLNYTKLSGPAWLIVAADGSLSGTPPSGSAGINAFTIQVDDGNALTATTSLEIIVHTPDNRGVILRELFNEGPRRVAELLSSPKYYPHSPYARSLDSTFQTGNRVDDYFSSRTIGYIHPPETGKYTFWIRADEDGELWLSSDEDPENAVRIAYTSGASRNFDGKPQQASVPILLTAGQKYFIKAVHTEHNNFDTLGVAWSGPKIPPQTIIDGAYMSPWVSSHPVFLADPFSPAKDAIADVPYNDSLVGFVDHPEEGELYYLKVSGPEWLTVAEDGTLSGTPGVNDLGRNTFTIRSYDNFGGNQTATMQIVVLPLIDGTILIDFAARQGSAGSVRGGDMGSTGGTLPADTVWRTISSDVGREGSISKSNYSGYGSTNSLTFNGSLIFGQDTGYTLNGKETGFNFEFSWRPATGWNQNMRMIAELYYSDDDTLRGNPTVVLVQDIKTTILGSWQNVKVVGGLDRPTKDGVGKKLFLRFRDEIASRNKFAYIDNIYLEAFDFDNTPPSFNEEPLILADALKNLAFSNTIVGRASDEDNDILSYRKVSRDGGQGVDWLTINPDGTLQGTPTDAELGAHSWTVQVSDINGATDTASLSITVTQPGGSGTILREWWLDIGSGKSVADLTSNADFPDNPSGQEVLERFEGPTNFGNRYGTRIRGFIHPPETGDYTFWISSDDQSELWLSPDSDPVKADLIARVDKRTASRQWDKYAAQRSVAISLVAGQKYYIEALHKDGGSGDHLAVAWSGPGIAQAVIDGAFLSPWVEAIPDSLQNFRQQYGLAEDGSQDMGDLSRNGLTNIAYFLFGLGTPWNPSIQNLTLGANPEAGLPILNWEPDGTVTFSHVRHKTQTSYEYVVLTSSDLVEWGNIEFLETPYRPTGWTTENIDDDYELRHLSFAVEAGERFVRIEIRPK